MSDPYDSCEEEADWIRGHSLNGQADEVVRNERADHERPGDDNPEDSDWEAASIEEPGISTRFVALCDF